MRLTPPATAPSLRYATRAINAVVVLQLRNYVDDSQHGTFRALGVVRMGKEGTEDGQEQPFGSLVYNRMIGNKVGWEVMLDPREDGKVQGPE